MITELRGFSALSVMLFHFVCVSNNYLKSEFLMDVFDYGKLGVQVFFIISGFILFDSLFKWEYRLKNMPAFILKRIIRIEPPYILSLVLIIFIAFIKFSLFEHGNGNEITLTVNQIISHLGYVIPFTHFNWLSIVYWTLAIEFQFYFLLAILFPLFSKKYSVYANICFLITCIILSNQLPEVELFKWFPIFLLGIMKAQFDHKVLTIRDYVISLGIVLTMIFYTLDTTTFIVGTLVTMVLNINKELKLNSLRFLGKISYSLYLFHTIIGFLLINVCLKISDNYVFRFSSFILISSVVIWISYVINNYVEIPFKKIASNIKFKK
jgi:peptidoglycan/LPS O-acetylase OafA/YrhL